MTGRTGSRARRAVLWAPVVLLIAFEFYLSSLSVLPSTGALGAIPHGDKLVHAAYFFLVAALAVRAARFGEGWSRKKSLLYIVVCVLLYGMLDELHQSFVPHRDVEALDVIADTLGALLGVVAGERLWIKSNFEPDR